MVVLDASALLALLMKERGAEQVLPIISGSVMSSVNLAEVVGFYAKAGARREDIDARLSSLPVACVPVDRELAFEAGCLQGQTLRWGLSLGDRICLALARQLGRRVFTADRAWLPAAQELDIEIVVIR